MTPPVMTKKSDAVKAFKKLIGPYVMGEYYTLPHYYSSYKSLCFFLIMSWERYVESLYENGSITQRQADEWDDPFNKNVRRYVDST